jgi:hypothetical protein
LGNDTFGIADYFMNVLRPELVIRIIMRRKDLPYAEAEEYFWARKWVGVESPDTSLDDGGLEAAAALMDQW